MGWFQKRAFFGIQILKNTSKTQNNCTFFFYEWFFLSLSQTIAYLDEY